MAAGAIGLALDQRRPLAPARAIGGGERGFRYSGEIIAVDNDARHRIGDGAGRDILDRGGARGRDRHAVEIVLADEHHGQLPDRSEIERLVEGAFVVGAVAEERHRDRAGFQPLGAERRADGDRQAAADNAVGAEIAAVRVGDVHRAAAPAAIAGLAAEKLGEHPLHLGALGDAMAVAAMCGGDVVAVGKRRADADGGGLLADRQVHRAVALAPDVAVLRRLLEAADQVHFPASVAELVASQTIVDRRTIARMRVGRGAGHRRSESHSRRKSPSPALTPAGLPAQKAPVQQVRSSHLLNICAHVKSNVLTFVPS